MTISLAMIVRNEAMHLARCLESVAGLVDELVVVDTGSDDDSREVARANGANVVEFPWCDDFAAARNVALDHATGDWVLQLDADEAIESGWHEGLRSLTGQAALAPCWLLRIVNLMNDRPPVAHHGSRLFRRLPEIRYGGRVHECIDQSLRIAGLTAKATNATITHYGYATPEARERKARRNLALHEAQLANGEFTETIWYYLYAAASQIADPSAERWLQLALADHARTGPGHRAELLLRLYQQHRESDPVHAAHYLKIALELAPDQTLGWVLRAQAQSRSGDFEGALASLNRAVRVASGEVCSQVTGDAVIEHATIERWISDIASRSTQPGFPNGADRPQAGIASREADHGQA